MPGNGGRDFWGNPVPLNSATDRGAHEWQGPPSNQPPVIRVPPASQAAVEGAMVVFEVIASGTPPLAYQWRKAGATVPEATQATLTLSHVSTNDAAAYQVVITNAFGAVTSATATLTVALPPPPSRTLAAVAWATLRDGANATVNLDEQALGYAMVKYNTNGLSAKTYLGFDLAGSRPDPDRPAQLTLQGFSNSGMQQVRLWALDQPCPEMSPDLVWNTAPATETNSNDLLRSGPRTATPILGTLLRGGPVTHTLTLPSPWNQWIQNQNGAAPIWRTQVRGDKYRENKTMNKPVIEPKQFRRKFNKTFKQHAVELWLNSGKAATEVAAELGIHAQRLSAWRKRSTEQLAVENSRLRRENDYRRQPRDILKKPWAFSPNPRATVSTD